VYNFINCIFIADGNLFQGFAGMVYCYHFIYWAKLFSAESSRSKREKENLMKKILIIISFIGLVLTLLPSFLVFANAISWDTYLLLMNVGTIMWFVSAPFWMEKKDEA
jgi:hypothetical protein